MRCFSIIALCLAVAASANAFDFKQVSQCVRDEVGKRVNDIAKEVNSRMDTISTEGSEATRTAREHFNEKVAAFKEGFGARLEDARRAFDDCVSEGSSKIVCYITLSRDMMTTVLPLATQKSVELIQAVAEITSSFGENRQAGLKDLMEKSRAFGRDLFSSLRNCAFPE